MVAALLLVVAVQAQDPVRVQAQLTRTEISVGETTVLRVAVETDGSRAQIQRIPSLPPGLTLVSSRDFDHRQFTVPGGGRRFVTREHVLQASWAGRYEVPAVDVVVDGARYSTRPLLLDVVGAAPAGPDAPVGQHGVVLRAWLDADTVYVGQQVTLQVETMFSQQARLRLRRAPEYEPPATSGFWVHDLPDSHAPPTRGTRGDVFETQTFRRAFFPVSPGTYEIPPARLFYEMRRGIFQAPETFTIESDPMRIVVLPLPDHGRPPSFTGAVGQFSAHARLEPDRVAAGEAAVLTLEVRGEGNMRMLPPPELPALPGVETFPPTERAETELRGFAVGGVKRFSWVIIPRQAGELRLPDIEYSAFDPVSREYRTATAPLRPLAVEPGSAPGRETVAAGLRYLKPRPAGSTLHWVRSPWFAGAQLLPALLFAGALVGRRRRAAGARTPARALRRRRKAALREIHHRASTGAIDFPAYAEAFARDWTAERLHVPRSALSRQDALVAAGVHAATARAFIDVVSRIAAARYAPTPPGAETCRELALALDRVTERIDREAPRPRRVAPAAAAVLLLAALSIATPPSPLHAIATPEAATIFSSGGEHFDAGRYPAAAAAFGEYVRVRGEDPAGWYNLGTARYRAGDQGHAIWAWLNAARLHPRDRDTRHNLRLAGAAPELVARVTPPVPLRTETALLLAALAWFAAGVGGAWWALRGGRAPVAIAATAAALALVLAASAWSGERRSPTLVVLADATLRAGPHLSAEPLAALPPGAGLVPVAFQSGWVRVRTLAGAEGWVEADVAGSVPAEPGRNRAGVSVFPAVEGPVAQLVRAPDS
jgi:hypothetical protein